MVALPGVVAKHGADGVVCAGFTDGVGVALKVEDGAQRAQGAAVLRLLQYLDALPDPLPPRLAEFLRKSLRNTRGETIGELRPVA